MPGRHAFHFRKAWAELGHFGVGLFWSVFCDFDLFPNSLDYWGPNGMALFPNIQVRWMPVMGAYTSLFCPGTHREPALTRVFIPIVSNLKDVKPHFPVPDLTRRVPILR